MHAHHQATIAKLTARFQHDPRFQALLIVGSVARGEARADSDIDFYLISTAEEYQQRQTTGELTIDAHDVADYPQGQASGTIVDLQFLRDAATRAPEPQRFAFTNALIAFSHSPDVEPLIKRIALYPEHERAEKMKSFVSQLPVHLSYMYLADYSSNPYLLAETAVELVLFGGRLLLAHNRMLYPNRKQFINQLEKAPDKPEFLLILATELLSHPCIDHAQRFYDSLMNFAAWPQPTEGAMARFKHDRDKTGNGVIRRLPIARQQAVTRSVGAVRRAGVPVLKLYGRWQSWAEVTLICVWAAWVGRAFLDFNPYTWPVGGEWGTQLQTHHLWIQLQRCGLCALWNGGINGGAPALADLFGSMLHPLVMLTTVLWGVSAGAKVAVVVALALGGIAQWWIARVLQLGTVARLWSALLAVVGGHLAGRMQNGNFGLVLSTAACSLALAAAFDLGVTRERRATLLLAVMGALALVSGQAYLQLALLGWSPAYLWLILERRRPWFPVGREYLLALGLALLLAGIFLVPLLHFWPHITKDTDPTFQAAQPLAYIPLNLVIAPQGSALTTTLGQLPYPYLYNLYIGWLAVLLALLSLGVARGYAQRQIWFLASGALLMFFLASATPLRWLSGSLPTVANIRHTPLLAGLTVPAIIGLASYTLDRLLKHPWPMLKLPLVGQSNRARPRLRPTWLLCIPLAYGLWTPATLAQSSLRTINMQSLYSAIVALRTPSLQWVAPPFGELRWTEAGLDLGLKLSPIVWVFKWQTVPMPYLEALRDGAPPALVRVGPLASLPGINRNDLGALPGAHAEPVGNLNDIPVYRYGEQHYAAVATSADLSPCAATGSGGTVMLTCTNEQAGELTVREHAWSGWSATRDNQAVALEPDQWLRLPAPAGIHRYVFRYRPWDVLLGAGLTFVGTMLTLWQWVRLRHSVRHPKASVLTSQA
ncbi:MAG: nucleotidyltransferase domain-containing protein [Herpetosiphonaceae bacterium]|nr:nucleotidyltransferase domain-containing protein [Herpetosiphonaceae bacterium]